MCGASRIMSKNSIRIDSLEKMNRKIRLRGPDHEGFVLFSDTSFEVLGSSETTTNCWPSNVLFIYSPQKDNRFTNFQDHFGLVHRRLSILDLSPKGHQPMCTNHERYWMKIINVEIELL